MKQISDANYHLVIRILRDTYRYNELKQLRQDETRRKAGLLYKKLQKQHNNDIR